MLPLLRPLLVWIASNPGDVAAAVYVVLNVVNGMLPATVKAGPLGAYLHLLLDRVALLTRRDARGTLKWPVVAGSILRIIADSLNPPAPSAPLPRKPLDVTLGDEKEATLDRLSRPETPEAIDPDEDARRSIIPGDAWEPSKTARPSGVHRGPTVPTRRKPEPPDQAGRVNFGTVVAAAVLGALVMIVLSIAGVVGCSPAELSMRAAPGVPDPNACTPQRHRCVLDGGVYLPVVCSSSMREWPSLPRRGNGQQRYCRPGEGCEITDAGIARCFRSAADGGVR